MNAISRRVIRSIPRPVKRVLKRFVYLGENRFCPICERSASKFLSFGVIPRDDVRCPECDSLERHRLMWRYLQLRTQFFQSRNLRVLHVAPEKCLEPRLRKMAGPGYLTGDLMSPADVKMDITDIQFPDASFDVIYCSHVLEHVPDDRKAMREFFRVLKPEGFALLLVPITAERTIEDPAVIDPQERLRLFGQEDHVRRYGPDYLDRLRAAGFDVETTRADDLLSADDIVRIAVSHPLTGEIYHCTKPRSS